MPRLTRHSYFRWVVFGSCRRFFRVFVWSKNIGRHWKPQIHQGETEMTTPEKRPIRGDGRLGFFFIIGLSFQAGMLVTAGFRYHPIDSDHAFLVLAGCALLGFAIFLAVKFVGMLRELGITDVPEPISKISSR
jgi:hypothetical protein